MVNVKAYQKLSSKNKNILKAAMKLAAYETNSQIYHVSSENLSRLKRDFPNVAVRAFPRDVYRALAKAANAKVNEMEAEGDALTKEIISSMRDYSEKVRLWTRFSDQAYLNNSF